MWVQILKEEGTVTETYFRGPSRQIEGNRKMLYNLSCK